MTGELYSTDAERVVLGTMLLDPSCIAAARARVGARDFFFVAHGLVFDTLLLMHDRAEPIDLVTVAEEMRTSGKLDVAGGPEALAALVQQSVAAPNVASHAATVRKYARRRRLRDLGRTLSQRAEDPIQDLAELEANAHAGLADLAASAADEGRFVAASLSGPAILEHAFPQPASLLGDGIISVGDLVVMFGEAGVSKTWLALQLGVAMARGEPWLGLRTTEAPVDVGFLELEVHAHVIQDRLRAIGGPVPQTFHLLVRPQLRGAVNLVDAQGRSVNLGELRAWIESSGLKVVVIDALARATSCPQVDFSPLLLGLDVLRAETACAVLLVHHENARSRGSANGAELTSDMDFMRGDSRLRGFPQAVLRVLEHHGARCVRFPKVSCAATPAPIYFKNAENGVPVPVQAPESVRGGRSRAIRDAIEQYVCRSDRPVTRADVGKGVGLGRTAATEHLRALLKAKRISSFGENRDIRYVPPTGVAGVAEAVGANGHGY